MPPTLSSSALAQVLVPVTSWVYWFAMTETYASGTTVASASFRRRLVGSHSPSTGRNFALNRRLGFSEVTGADCLDESAKLDQLVPWMVRVR